MTTSTPPAIHFVVTLVPVTRKAYAKLAKIVGQGSPDVPASTVSAEVEELCFYGLLVKVADRLEVSAKAWKVLDEADTAEMFYNAMMAEAPKAMPVLKPVGQNPVNSVYYFFSECMVLEATRCEYSTLAKMAQGETCPTCSATRLRNLVRAGFIKHVGGGRYELTEYAENKMLRGESRWFSNKVEEATKRL